MKVNLEVFPSHRGYGIAWTDDEGEDGLYLGEPAPDDAEHIAASRAACSVHGPEMLDERLFWRTEAHAKLALRAAKAAVKSARESRSWPEWATTALAAGWKPPKGWTP